MFPIQKVALAGATGNFGKPVLQALLDANFQVTVLTRPGSKHTFPQSANVQQVDFGNLDALTSALRGQEAFISMVGAQGFEYQKNMVDAAVAAEVRLLIPSEFGSDIENPKVRDFPLWTPKREMQEYMTKTTKGTRTAWTTIRNGPFLDFCVDVGLLINIPKRKINLYDGGDVPFTTTPISIVAQAIVEVLRKPERTENRIVKIQGALVTQNQLLRLAQKYTGDRDWEISFQSSEEVENGAWRQIRESPNEVPRSAFMSLLIRAIFGEGYGGKFGNSDNDNELLGIKAMTEQDIEEFVKSRAQG